MLAPAPDSSTRAAYPAHIVLSGDAELYLDRLGLDLASGAVDYQQLPASLRQFYALAYEAGRASLQPALDQANHDADRLYTEVCRRPPSSDHRTLDEHLAAQRHRGAEAARQRAAALREHIGGSDQDRYPTPTQETE